MAFQLAIKVAATLVTAFIMVVSTVATAEEVQTRTDGLVYQVPISYDDSLYKENAMVKGAYLYYGYGEDRSYEMGVDFTEITYKPDINYEQKDYTFVYSAYGNNKKNRYGIHHITSSTDANDGTTFFAGGSNYSDPGRTKTLNVYYSSYDDATHKVKALQLSPSMGYMQYRDGAESRFALTSLHYIRLDEEVGLEGDNFISIEQSITFLRNNYSVTVRGWVGEQMYAVGNDGFAVSNKPELNEGGYGIQLKFGLQNETSFTIGADIEKFKDTWSVNGATARKYTFMLGHSF